MNTSTNDGGPAFPSLNSEMTGIDSNGVERFDTEESGGMTLRDYFAAKALSVVVAGNFEMGQDHLRYDRYEQTALDAYKLADAMIKARSATV